MMDFLPILLDDHSLDALAAVLYFGVVAGYFIFYRHMLLYYPQSITQGRINDMRHQWVRHVMERQNGILAVQATRNLIMSSSLLASTAILLNIGVLSQWENLGGPLRQIFDSPSVFWNAAKTFSLILIFSYNFFNFLICIRDLNYFSFVSSMNVPDLEDDEKERIIRDAQRLFDHAGLTYTRGVRGFFFALPLFLWYLHPLPMLAGTLVILLLQLRRDLSRITAAEVSPLEINIR